MKRRVDVRKIVAQTGIREVDVELVLEEANAMNNHFGYIFAGKNEGMILFALDDIEGLHVYPAHNNRNPQFELKYRTADHKPTGKKVRLYHAESYHAVIEIVCGDQSEIMTIKNGEVSFN